MKKPDHIQNKAVKPSWSQLWREIICSIKGHVFHVAWGDGFRGLPQSHCYRCGRRADYAVDTERVEKWVEPIG